VIFDHPWVLLFLPIALIPLLLDRQHTRSYSWLSLLPRDRLSDLLGLLLKILAAVALFFMIVGMAGPATSAQHIERVGVGAQLVLVIDRSASMDDAFSGAARSGRAGETKAGAAERLITEFVKQRSNDMFGMVTFSSSAMHALPLTDSREAILAAIKAAGGIGLFQTNIGSGLTTALAQFDKTPDSGSRAIILLSDGGGRMSSATQEKIRDWLDRMHVTLYWIVLRQPGAVSIFDTNYKQPEDQAAPAAIELNEYFRTLRSGYQPYEAEDPASLAAAIADINRKEKKPIRYLEEIPGRDFTPYCYLTAAAMIALLLVVRFFEVRTWH
jgi:mxaC protein